MIELPDFKKAYDYENGFYLSCQSGRLGKLLAHYELYRRVIGLPGALVECGIFKGASFARFAMFRSLFENEQTRKIVGFDIFGKFPKTNNEADRVVLEKFLSTAGDESISVDQLTKMLANKGCGHGVELIEGDINATVPAYVQKNPAFRISLLNLDVDILEPNAVVLEYFWPLIVRGGVLILDDYGIFPGATEAVERYFAGQAIEIQKFPYAFSPAFIVKQ